jgi:hypothetical protein
MATLTLRIPDDKHARLRELVRQPKISVNKLSIESPLWDPAGRQRAPPDTARISGARRHSMGRAIIRGALGSIFGGGGTARTRR